MFTETETTESKIFETVNFDAASQLRGLIRAIELSDEFSLLFARCNQRPSQKKLIDKLKETFPQKKVEVIFFEKPINNLLDELRNRANCEDIDLLLIYGLESSVPDSKNAKKNTFIRNLNASRNSFPRVFKCPTVLFLPEYIISGIMLGATDFFSVRSGVFYFESEKEAAGSQSQQVNLINEDEIGSLTIEEREARIKNIKELLEEKQSNEYRINLHLNLGEIYYFQADYKKAEIEYNLALDLAIKENNKELEAESYNNLAGLYYLQGRYEETEPLVKKALAIHEKVFGENYPETATNYNNLAEFYRTQSRYEEAEPLLKQALEVRKKVLGENHPSTANSYNNLAGLYYSQGRYKEVESLFKQALEIRKKVLGENHPDTAGSYNNLGVFCANQGKFAEAKDWLEKALVIRQKVLGNQHPYTITTRESLENVKDMLGE